MYYGDITRHNYFKIILKKPLTIPPKSPIIYLLIERETTERETNSRDRRQGSFDRPTDLETNSQNFDHLLRRKDRT